MSGSSSLSIALALCLLTTAVVLSTVCAGGEQFYDSADMGWLIPAGSGLVGDAEAEFELDSESNRRILATTRYISYGALQRNSVPCSRRGQSYYNCRPGAPANPYTRGCSAITRCRS
ncbi:OLC1v1000354C1 [Oldenlandia corymbosa var. corymbosa]|uniref:OLC1v1000354C1 n=1 Tax=Oldenlandia corymbosa var. corymbosa TaxID=529605 RepID=A0AAV1D2M3_OLDCO|nr:OLC1v1000354C1 [Oldenlandia corymbosa var. corymbosa]